MVAAKVLFKSLIGIYIKLTIRIVLEENPVCVRWTLLILIDKDVGVFTSLIGRPELYLRLNIPREHLVLGHLLV